jgi:hypothetical protein
MESVLHIDPISNLQHLIDKIFRTIFPSEEARRFFHFTGLSEKISSEPGWYLWFSDVPGVYLLDLKDAQVLQEDALGTDSPEKEGYTLLGYFIIKYFPSLKDDKYFMSFSEEEKKIRASRLFDHTGTPTLEGNDKIPPPFFQVGHVNILFDGKRKRLEVSLLAPDRWMTMQNRGLEKHLDQVDCREMPIVEIRDRDVPAWELSFFLVDRLINGLGYVYKTKPQCVHVFQRESPPCDIQGEDEVCRESISALKELILFGSFIIPDDLLGMEKEEFDIDQYNAKLEEWGKLNGWKLLEWQRTPPKDSQPWINPSWWEAANIEINQKDVTFC